MWYWLGINAGQIQSIVALIGLGVAAIAIIYSYIQVNLAKKERLFSLKYQVVTEHFAMLKNIESMQNKIRLIQKIELRDSLNSTNNKIKDSAQNLHNTLEDVSVNLEITKSELLSFQKNFKDEKSSLTLEGLEKILDSQINIQETLSSTQHRLNRMEISVNIAHS